MALAYVGGVVGPLSFFPPTVAVVVVIFVVVAQPLSSSCIASYLVFGIDDDVVPSLIHLPIFFRIISEQYTPYCFRTNGRRVARFPFLRQHNYQQIVFLVC